MFIGTADFTGVFFVAIFSFIILAFLEYYLCTKAKHESTKKLLFFIPFFILTGAMILYGASDSTFEELRRFIALFITGYGFLCLLAIITGFGIYTLQQVKKAPPEIPADCPINKADNNK